MRQVEFHRYWVTAQGRKRPYLTRFPMTAEHAASQYLTARPDPATREVREIPETDAERAALQSAGHNGVKTSRSQ